MATARPCFYLLIFKSLYGDQIIRAVYMIEPENRETMEIQLQWLGFKIS